MSTTITKEEFEQHVKSELYKIDGVKRETVNKEIAIERDWLNSFYNEGLVSEDFDNAVRKAVDNFAKWL